MAIIENEYRIGIKYVDKNGLLSLKGIILLLEDIACYHSDLVGFGIRDIPKTHFSWIILNWRIKVFNKVNYGSNVTVKTWSRQSEKLYTYRDFEIYDENNNLICIATSKWVLISTDTGRINLISEEVRNAYLEEKKSVFEEENFPKLIEPTNDKKTFSFTVNRRDIDVNEHMNNLYYLEYALEALPEDIYLKSFNNVEITYKSSAKLGNVIDCFYKEENGCYYITMKSATDNILSAIIKLY